MTKKVAVTFQDIQAVNDSVWMQLDQFCEEHDCQIVKTADLAGLNDYNEVMQFLTENGIDIVYCENA